MQRHFLFFVGTGTEHVSSQILKTHPNINASKLSGSNDAFLKSKQRLSLSSQTRKKSKKNYSSPVKNIKKPTHDLHDNNNDSTVPTNIITNLLPPRPANTFTIQSKPSCSTITNKNHTPLANLSPKTPPKKSNIETIVKKIAATGGKKQTVSSTDPNPSSMKNKITVNNIKPTVEKKNTTKNVRAAPQPCLGNTTLSNQSKAIHDMPLTSQIQGDILLSRSSLNMALNPNSSLTSTFSAASKTTQLPNPPVSSIATCSYGSLQQTKINPVSANHSKTPNHDTVVIIDSDDEEESQPKITNNCMETPRVVLNDIRKTASKPSTLNSSVGSLNSGSSELVSEKKISKKIKIKMMEKKLELLEKKINKFAEQEVSLFEMDNEESAYIQEAKLKEEFIRNWRKYCKMVGDDPDEYVSVRKKVKVRSAPFPEINREVERYINRNGSFPNVFDIKSVCIQANNKHNLEIKEIDLQNIAVDVFTEVGQKLQKTREKDLRATSGNALTDLALKTPDPALEDQDLKLKLKRNKKIAKKKTEDVFNDYVRQQYEQMRGGDDQDSSDANDNGDDDDANDMETLRRKNLIENKKVKQKLIKDKTGWKEPTAKKAKRVENTTVINVTLSSQEEPVNNKQKKIDCLVTVNASSPKYTSGSPKPQQHSISSTVPSTSVHKNDSPKPIKKLSKPTIDLPKPLKKLPQTQSISSVTDSLKQSKKVSQPVIKPMTDSTISKKISKSETKPVTDSSKQVKVFSQSPFSNTSETNSKLSKMLTQPVAKRISDSSKLTKKLVHPQVTKQVTKNQVVSAQKPLNNDNKEMTGYISNDQTKPGSTKIATQLNEVATSSLSSNTISPASFLPYKTLLNNQPPHMESPTTSPLSKKKKLVEYPLKSNFLQGGDQQLKAGDFPGFVSKHATGTMMKKVEESISTDTLKTLPGNPSVHSYESPLKRFRSIQSPETLSGNKSTDAVPKSTGPIIKKTISESAGGSNRLTGVKPPIQNDQIVVIDDSDDDE